MKITINIEERVIKGMIAIARLQEDDSIPEDLEKKIEEAKEIDITKVLTVADEYKQLTMALALSAIAAIAEKS